MKKDKARDLLKQILQGKVEAEQVYEELKKINPLTDMVPVFTYADEPGIYEVGNVAGLTEDEMKVAIADKNPFIIRVHCTGHPLAHSEREVLERIKMEQANGQ